MSTSILPSKRLLIALRSLVACHRRGEMLLEVDVRVIAYVEDDLHDLAAPPFELRRVLRADGVAAVVPDAEAFAAERVERGDRADLALGEHFVVDVQLRGADRLVVFSEPLLGELDAHRVPARPRRRPGEALLRRDAEEVEDVGQRAVVDEQRVATEA